MDQDPQLPSEAVSQQDVQGERGECPAGVSWGVPHAERLLAPPGIGEDDNPDTHYGD